jgi:hypothetical protein
MIILNASGINNDLFVLFYFNFKAINIFKYLGWVFSTSYCASYCMPMNVLLPEYIVFVLFLFSVFM